MRPDDTRAAALTDVKIHVKLKLAALWTVTMFCYVYGDLFGFFRQAMLRDVVSGRAGFIGTPPGLLAAAVTVTIPSLMIVLSLVLRPFASRWSNIVVGVVYTVIAIATTPGAWAYYIFLSAVEAVLTILVVCYAWSWPKSGPP